MKIQIKLNKEQIEPLITVEVEKVTSEINSLLDTIKRFNESKIVAFKDREAQVISTREIVRVYTENGKTIVRLKNDYLNAKSRIYEMEESLPKDEFIKISQGEIVNVNWMEKFDLSNSGSIIIKLKNYDISYTSRRYVPKIKEFLKAIGGK